MADISPGAQQKAQLLNLTRNRRGQETSAAGRIAGAAAAPQFAAVQTAITKISPKAAEALKLNRPGMRAVWRVLLWTLPLSAPLILLLILLLMFMVVLG